MPSIASRRAASVAAGHSAAAMWPLIRQAVAFTGERSHIPAGTLRFVFPLAVIAQSAPNDLGPELDSVGAPQRPVLIVDADSTATDVEIERASMNLSDAGAITVAVSTRELIDPRLTDAVDIAIVRNGSKGPGRLVEATDALAAAAHLQTCVAANPVAALSLSWLLRSSASSSIQGALTQESAVYSTLLGGAEFRSWLQQRGDPRPPDGPLRVEVTRHGDVLSIVLNRIARRNAVDARMRDALREALGIALVDTSLHVQISGTGSCFSAGGDLDEFGTATDAAVAHLIRVDASVGAVLDAMRHRVTVRVHGACIGAGIEIPAFAARVVAAADARFSLPELGMGLIPGAGGTVSITRRIGRQRTLWMALTGTQIDVSTAVTWGLIDAVE
jgi:Enoyl-CoA hydratase/isomerase